MADTSIPEDEITGGFTELPTNNQYSGPTANNYVEKFVRNLPTIAGGTLGAIYGGPLGAGAGAMAGKALQARFIEDPGGTDTPSEALKQIGLAGLEGATLDGAGRVVGRVAGPILSKTVGPYLKGATRGFLENMAPKSTNLVDRGLEMVNPYSTALKATRALGPAHASGKLAVDFANNPELLNVGPFAQAGASKIRGILPSIGARSADPAEILPPSDENVYYPNRAPASPEGPIVEDPGRGVPDFNPRGAGNYIPPTQEIQMPESIKVNTSNVKVNKFPNENYNSPEPYKTDTKRVTPFIMKPSIYPRKPL